MLVGPLKNHGYSSPHKMWGKTSIYSLQCFLSDFPVLPMNYHDVKEYHHELWLSAKSGGSTVLYVRACLCICRFLKSLGYPKIYGLSPFVMENPKKKPDDLGVAPFYIVAPPSYKLLYNAINIYIYINTYIYIYTYYTYILKCQKPYSEIGVKRSPTNLLL